MCDENGKAKRSKRISNKAEKAENINSIEGVYKSPKNWKEMYLRSEKQRRSRQLGFEYPRRSVRQMLDDLDK
jgi:hypothetical protein